MALTSRKKRPLKREMLPLRDASLIIIACEGQKTEKQYFNSEIFHSSRLQVIVLETKDGNSAPKHILERLRKYKDSYKLEANDQLWLMIDVDRWPNEQISEVCGEALKIKNTSLAVSNPCFEVWLYLHFEAIKQTVNSKDIESMLKAKMGGSYNKSNLEIEHFKGSIIDAVGRSKELDKDKVSARWPGNPGTHVYKVIEEIWKIIKS
ncbi:RloB domain-containing protein [Leptospira sp. 201903070]|uniref:RloB domain-containing protein n=1 Tax=Leptospira ainlahdjerensis TaxID=2810033 RepID=A0ABS2UHW7_9LEPT|nr:RloB family protein [Leptospira ainlahdjerensis]MBM9578897.1 RloB domain-containing protein [Leptospira ainlahdjerensis]